MWENKMRKLTSQFSLSSVRTRRRVRNLFYHEQNSKKIILALVILITLALMGGYFFKSHFSSPQSSMIKAEKQVVLPPVSIRIPSLGVETEIESVAKDSEGRMDVPKNVMNTAWYNLGPKPGEIGNAVIAGHLDTPKGKPAVFSKLDTLKKDAVIEVVDAGGTIYIYRVIETKTYPIEEFPIVTVFGPHDKTRLNLITCDGAFDEAKKTYSERTVVFSELVKIQNK